AHAGDLHFVVTARCENYLRNRPDLAATIARLQSFQEAGADVLYAPGITDPGDIRSLVASVDRPVNVLAMPSVPPVEDLAAAGVARVSVGSALANVALGAVVQAACELKKRGTYAFWSLAAEGSTAARSAFRT
ncbi:MAG TPA: isocitrate lyase/phosphoenolpyruvate mutase family protein, partial [Acidimicrobiales bacterium]